MNILWMKFCQQLQVYGLLFKPHLNGAGGYGGLVAKRAARFSISSGPDRQEICSATYRGVEPKSSPATTDSLRSQTTVRGWVSERMHTFRAMLD
ncbi:hypothetical protein ACLFKS_32355 [Paraburkholderia sp. BR10879]|uniref:hypothetical protein n=1 Tax=Paraburkholderia sp. BR10882 TaxID=3236991 RepID=UPI0034CEA822